MVSPICASDLTVNYGSFCSFGVEFSVSGSEALDSTLVLANLLDFPHQPIQPGAHSFRFGIAEQGNGLCGVFLNEECFCSELPQEQAIRRLQNEIQFTIAQHSPYLFVHAGAVASERGAILLPGQSYAGKSTLVRSLVEAGARYLSDEFAVLDAEGRVHPFPRSLWLRNPERIIPPQEVGVVESQPQPVALAASLQYQQDCGEQSWHEASKARGILLLFEHCVSAQRMGQQALDILNRALTGARILSGARGDSQAAARAILELAKIAPGQAGASSPANSSAASR